MVSFTCEPCNYTTNDKSNFSKHLLSNKHNNNTNSEQIQPRINLYEIIKIKNNYKCNHCNKLFDNIELIEKHVKLECKYDVRYNNFYVFDNTKLGRNIFQDSEQAGDVYIIQTDFSQNNIFKIGISHNLENRLKQYRTGCNYEPKVHYYFPCKDILGADKILKNKLRQFHVKREIYKGDIEMIKDTIMKNLRSINGKVKVKAYKLDVRTDDICECVDCNKVFFTRIDLAEHNKEYHDMIPESYKIYKCDYCERTYSTISNLAKHKKKCNEKKILVNNHKEEILALENKYKDEIQLLKKEEEIHLLKKELEYKDEIQLLKKELENNRNLNQLHTEYN